MSVVDRGERERAEQERRRQEADAHRREQNKKHAINRFRMDFYRDHIVPNPKLGAYPSYVEDPDNRFPEITDWHDVEPDNAHGERRFVCEGLRYVVRWKWWGGSDRAYWDDGWWPDWFLVLPRFRWLPFLTREVQVHGPQNVADAVKGRR